MKILYLKLKNVIGIKSGLGLDEIELDFSKTKKKVILLLGSNGSGKSTIISSLHPFSEAFNNKKNYIIKGKEGYKEIHIADNDSNIYKIIHHYGKRSNKSFIMKNDVELNINGGIRTFEDIITSELGITKDFFKLIKLGASTNNFVDLNSSARKQFIGNFMPNIEEYLKAYAIINKKILTQNKEVKFISDELNKLGNLEELISSASSITNRITNIDNVLIDLKVKLKHLEDDYADITTNEKVYTAKIEEHTTNEEKLISIDEYISTLMDKYPNSFKGKNLKELEKYETEISFQVQKHVDALKDLLHKKDILNIELRNINLEITKINNRINSMSGPNVDITKTTNTINTLKKNIAEYDKFFTECNKEFLDIAPLVQPNIEFLRVFLYRVLELKNKITLMDNFNHKEVNNIENLNLEVDALNTQITKLQKKFSTIRDEVIKNEASKQISSLCTNTTCKVFNLKEKFNDLDLQLSETEEQLNALNIKLKDSEEKLDNLNILNNLITPITKILIKIPKEIISYLFGNTFDVIGTIVDTSMETIEERLNLERFKFFFEYSSLRENDTNRLSELERSLEMYVSSQNTYNILKEEKSKITPNIQTLNNELTLIDEEIASKNNIIPKGNVKLSTIRSLITVMKESNFITNTLNQDKDTIDKYKLNLLNIQKYSEAIERDKQQIKVFVQENILSKKELDRINIEILRLNEFNTRLENINLKRKKYLVIKDSLDIKTGIPLVLLGSYMENIKHVTNNLLSIAFKNNFLIDFNVTDSEFNIPVIKDNDVTEDINECSDGQIALCKTSLSLGIIIEAISKSPKKYNIVYLDEVDSTLDVENKLAFLSILDTQLKLLDSEQCFVITHNDNFSQSDIGLILLRNANVNTDDKDFMFNKEIIKDFR